MKHVDPEIIVSRFLRVGVVVSATVISIGLLLFLVGGTSGYPGETYPTTIQEILAGLVAFKPYAIILFGLLLLVLTPVFRVVVSIFIFYVARDYLYVGITILVFCILLISFFIGKAG